MSAQWLVVSEAGFHTVRGWNPSANRARRFSYDDAVRFVEANSEAAVFLLVVRDHATVHDKIHVLAQKQESSPTPVHHLNSLALEHLGKLQASDSDVQLVRVAPQRTVSGSRELARLAEHAIRTLRATKPAKYQKRFEVALVKFDAAFEAFRRRLNPL